VAYITIKNTTNWDMGFLKEYAKKLQPFVNLVTPDSYPFQVTVVKKKGPHDRSSYDLDTHQLILKIDMTTQDKEDVAWVLAHEFCHFLTANNPELKKTALSEEHDTLEKILEKSFKIDNSKMREIFHDFLPPEVAANFFATMLIGKFHKRHAFSNVEQFIRGQKSGRKEKRQTQSANLQEELRSSGSRRVCHKGCKES
jgi:hypothetical protein